MRKHLLAALLIASLPTALCAEPAPESASPAAPAKADVASIIAKLTPQRGSIDIDHGLATLDLPSDLGYLPPDQTYILYRDVLHYPVQQQTLGALVPLNVPIGSPASWSAALTYQRDGNVTDADAPKLDPAVLLAYMKNEEMDYTAKLKQQGLSKLSVELVGWVKPPHYDTEKHTLEWGLEIVPPAGQHVINYNFRLLGRHGMLGISTVTPMEQLPAIEGASTKIAAALKFNPTYGYTDFMADTDKKAPYGLVSIVTGHAAAVKAQHTATTLGQWMLASAMIAAAAFIFKGVRRKKAES